MPRRYRVVTALLALVLALPTAFFLLVDADRYRPTVQAQVAAATGAQLRLSQPLRWQLWPLGLKLPALSLHDAQGELLLRARSGGLALELASLFGAQAQARRLVLRDIDLYYQGRPDGGTNWSAVLGQLRRAAAGQGPALRLEQLRVQRLSPEQQVAELEYLQLGGPQSGQRALMARFHLLPTGFTAWGELQAALRESPAGLSLQGLQLKAELGSPRIPGTVALTLSGDLDQTGTRWASPALTLAAAYKHLGMSEPYRLSLSGSASLDLAAATLSLNQGQLALAGLRLSELKLRASAQASGVRVPELSARLGQGRVSMPSTLVLQDEQPVLNSQFQVDGLALQDLAPLLGTPAPRGRLSASGRMRLAQWDQPDLLSVLQGELELVVQQLESPGGASLEQRLHQHAALLPPLARPLPALPAALGQLTVSSRLEAGTVHSILRADWGPAQATLTGRYLPARRSMDYRGELELARELFAGARPALRLALECKAELEEQISLVQALARDCGVAEASRRELMALTQRFAPP